VGHIDAHCHNCGGFGQKSKDCWNSRRQSMRDISFYMARRENEAWKKDNVRMEAQKTSVEKPGHFQKWMKKTEHQDMNKCIQNEESLTFYEAYAGSYGNSCVYTQFV
jgi:mevalonate pyrophosphate decarboxylase